MPARLLPWPTRAEPIEIDVVLPPEAMLARLRDLAAGWRRSALAPSGLAAGVSGWNIEERSGQMVLLPRTLQGGAIPMAIFVGTLTKSATGSRLAGVIRLHRGALIFLVAMLALAVLMPIGALFEATPREDWHQHVVRARTLALYSAGFIAIALAMTGFAMRRVAGQIRALLTAAAGPDGAPAPDRD